MKRLLALLAALVAIAVPSSAVSATADTATATVSATEAPLGAPITLTATNPCTTTCTFTWTWLNGLRLGARLGTGREITTTVQQLTTANKTPYMKIQLDLSEPCAPGSRLWCHSFAFVYVNITPQAAAVVSPFARNWT